MSQGLADWARNARFAGSKDRAFIRGLCLEALRRWRSFGGARSARSAVLLTLRESWAWPSDRIEAAFAGEHGPGALSEGERAARADDVPDLPDLVLAELDDPVRVSRALAMRAPVDLRANRLKADRAKALKALRSLGAEAAPLSPIGIRIPPPDAAEKGPGVTVIPAYGKGWVEVQDEASQLTVLAAGDLHGAQVLDYCAGGGGKTLALAAEMKNSGQVFAFDSDAGRVAPIFERLRRAGARNVQVIPPDERDKLASLERRMDLVFVDAPCSGCGTWRRHPDAKWRLTAEHLAARQAEQDRVLREASRFVKPGGELLFVTCSFLRSENDERIADFLAEEDAFVWQPPLEGASESVAKLLAPFVDDGALRLSPWGSSTDGFTLIRLKCRVS